LLNTEREAVVNDATTDEKKDRKNQRELDKGSTALAGPLTPTSLAKHPCALHSRIW
jgi:hypothetical protein